MLLSHLGVHHVHNNLRLPRGTAHCWWRTSPVCLALWANDCIRKSILHQLWQAKTAQKYGDTDFSWYQTWVWMQLSQHTASHSLWLTITSKHRPRRASYLHGWPYSEHPYILQTRHVLPPDTKQEMKAYLSCPLLINSYPWVRDAPCILEEEQVATYLPQLEYKSNALLPYILQGREFLHPLLFHPWCAAELPQWREIYQMHFEEHKNRWYAEHHPCHDGVRKRWYFAPTVGVKCSMIYIGAWLLAKIS